MAQMPIEIAEIGLTFAKELRIAIDIANSIQKEFVYINLSHEANNPFSGLSYREATVDVLMNELNQIRDEMKGFHPFLVAIVDAKLSGENLTNLFGSLRSERGIAIVTTSNVENIIIQNGRMTAYFLYYLARCTLKFIVPDHKNHEETRECLYDLMKRKTDILKSMKANAICDPCRKSLLAVNGGVSSKQLQAINEMLIASGEILVGRYSHLQNTTEEPTATIEPLGKIKSNLDSWARNKARLILGGYLLFLIVIIIFLALLTIRLGWGAMEPWTYFISLISLLGGYVYFVYTEKEWSPPEIYNQMIENNKIKIYQQYGLDINKPEKIA